MMTDTCVYEACSPRFYEIMMRFGDVVLAALDKVEKDANAAQDAFRKKIMRANRDSLTPAAQKQIDESAERNTLIL